MANQFDLEQGIMSCWHVTDDLNVLLEELVENQTFTKDQASNFVLGLATIYEAKFDKLFRDFESFLKEHYSIKNEAEQFKAAFMALDELKSRLDRSLDPSFGTNEEPTLTTEAEEQEAYNRLMDEYDIIDLVEEEGSIF